MRSNVNTASAQKFVSALKLPSSSELRQPSVTIRPELRAEIDPNQPSASVVSGGTVSFVAGISKQHREDVENSALLAQLAANKQFDREKDTENWYQFYRSVLENIGWVVPEFSFDRFQGSGDSFTMDKVIVDLIASVASENEVAIVTSTINALKKLNQGNDALVIYERDTHSAHQGNFQAHSVTESDGVVVMNIGTFRFSTEETVTRILFFNFPTSRTNFFQGGQNMNLDDSIFSQVRQAIKIKLGDAAKNFVKDLEI